MSRAALTWAVGSVGRVGRLPHAVVGAVVAVHRVLSEAVAVFTMKSTVDALLFLRAEELPVQRDVRPVAGRPWADAHSG